MTTVMGFVPDATPIRRSGMRKARFEAARAAYRRLRKLGVPRALAWNTAKSAHGPWRISHSPALYQAMRKRYFRDLGLPELAAR